jgi:hypothetical protein
LVQCNGQAIHRPPCNEGIKIVSGLRSALVLQAVLAPAKLATLRRINAPKANARPVHFQRITIDDARLPSEVISERSRYRPNDQKREARSYLEQMADRRLIFGDAVEIAHWT